MPRGLQGNESVRKDWEVGEMGCSGDGGKPAGKMHRLQVDVSGNVKF